MSNGSSKPWGLIDTDGNLVGKLFTFPPKVTRGNLRFSYKSFISHNSGASPEKTFHYVEGLDRKCYCTATYKPASPRGSWEVFAWGDSSVGTLQILNATLKKIGIS